jgi:hypothetical protein
MSVWSEDRVPKKWSIVYSLLHSGVPDTLYSLLVPVLSCTYAYAGIFSGLRETPIFQDVPATPTS